MKYLKFAFGAPLFMTGWYFFFVSAHMLLNQEMSLTRIALGGTFGLIGAFVGGWIMMPVLAEQIADELVSKIIVLRDIIPGGRRRTDPPVEDKPTEDL